MEIIIFPNFQNATMVKIILPYTIMIKKLLITIIVSIAASSGVLAGLPLGYHTNRHFYKDQDWLWNAQEQSAQPAQQNNAQAFTSTTPTVVPETGSASAIPSHRTNTAVAFTMLAFTMPTHRPEAELAFTMPTHRPEAELAFTMPTHRPEAELAFTMPTHRPEAELAFTMPTHRPEAEWHSRCRRIARKLN